MALTQTTLSSACGATDQTVVLASTTGLAAGHLIKVDQELMQVTKSYTNAAATVPVPVLRGRDGSPQRAHVSGALAIFGKNDGVTNDWAEAPAGTAGGTTSSAPMTLYSVSVSATSTLTLPPPNSFTIVSLNGTNAITLTVPVPTAEMNGNTVMLIVSNGVAQHIPTFTSGLNGVGTGYTAFTGASGAKVNMLVVASGGYWNVISAPAWTGTVTKLIGGIA